MSTVPSPMSNFQAEDLKEYNPSDLANLVRYCVLELMNRQAYRFPLPDGPFSGAGIYALFYDGSFPQYQHPSIRSDDLTRPIYVGRARLTRSSGKNPLFHRLKEHERSISAASNLSASDFACRFLVLHPLWVSTVEDILIEHYGTLWNGALQGFGVHDPGSKRHTGKIPLWDALHPGREHAKKMVAKGAAGASPMEIDGLIQRFTNQARAITPLSLNEAQEAFAFEDAPMPSEGDT